jgi:uncharacterized protein (DUF2147 family)
MTSLRFTLVFVLALVAPPAWAQAAASPSGVWRSVDDQTGSPRALVRIFEQNGMLYGRVEKIFDPKQAVEACEKCSGDRRGKPVQGLDIIRGLHPDGTGAWSGGEILDPETGDTYRASLRVTDNGRKLVLRGSVLGGLIGRSQTWLRADSN